MSAHSYYPIDTTTLLILTNTSYLLCCTRGLFVFYIFFYKHSMGYGRLEGGGKIYVTVYMFFSLYCFFVN